MKKPFLVSLVGVALMAVACDTETDGTGGAGGSGTTSDTTSTGASMSTTTTSGASMTSSSSGMAAAPTVSFTVDPVTVTAGATVTATVTVTDFILVEPKGQANKAGEGHYHIYLDQQQSYLIAGQTPTASVKIPAGTAAGPHTLRINLTDNKHVPLKPPVENTFDITVQ